MNEISCIFRNFDGNCPNFGEFGIENVQIWMKSVEIVKNLLILMANFQNFDGNRQNFGEIVVEKAQILVRLVEKVQNLVKISKIW